MPTLLNQIYQKIKAISGDGAYDTRLCYQAGKGTSTYSPRAGAAYWDHGHLRNCAVANQRIQGNNEYRQKTSSYHKKDRYPTSFKRLFGFALSLRDSNSQVGGSLVASPCVKQINRARYA